MSHPDSFPPSFQDDRTDTSRTLRKAPPTKGEPSTPYSDNKTPLAASAEARKGTPEKTLYPQYRKTVRGWNSIGQPKIIEVDVYAILGAFNVTNPATQHAIKKLLRAGTDHNDTLMDLQEAKDALDRAMEIERGKA